MVVSEIPIIAGMQCIGKATEAQLTSAIENMPKYLEVFPISDRFIFRVRAIMRIMKNRTITVRAKYFFFVPNTCSTL